MNVAFRVDASIEIGAGHVMRCLTLAEELQRHGHDCCFICRAHKGHLGDLITSKGFELLILSEILNRGGNEINLDWNPHAKWLGVFWQTDAEQTSNLLKLKAIDWLVVDHYALDAKWEKKMYQHVSKIMVIDDLADRAHQCEILLDQTFGRDQKDYGAWVPNGCEILCGTKYALLRPEFSELRKYSLERRKKPALKQLLITMGGVDKENCTGTVLDAVISSCLPSNCNVVVVLGRASPWLPSVKEQIAELPWSVEIKVNVSNMAQLMAQSDLAIGAAGATSWERCCVGLPTIMLILADNQAKVAYGLGSIGAVEIVDRTILSIKTALNSKIKQFLDDPKSIARSINLAASVLDGKGVKSVYERMVVERGE
ncbi:UDP-2,4-diacetamido-2,4,6-trideoxy-beta-L-altropyranose hydrolase [Aurantivibrio plasticivorans]